MTRGSLEASENDVFSDTHRDAAARSSLGTARGYAKANNVQLKKALGEW